MRPRVQPEPVAPSRGADFAAQVDRALFEANAARERGEDLRRHAATHQLEELCGPLAAYVFDFTPTQKKFTTAELDAMAAGLVAMAGP